MLKRITGLALALALALGSLPLAFAAGAEPTAAPAPQAAEALEPAGLPQPAEPGGSGQALPQSEPAEEGTADPAPAPTEEPAPAAEPAPDVSAEGPVYYATAGGEANPVNASAREVVDWVHINAAGSYNSKANVAGERLRFEGTGSASTSADWTNFAFSYTDGTNPIIASGDASFRFYTGKGSTGTFTAPGAAGVTRTLEIYMGSWAAKEVQVTAARGGAAMAATPFTAGGKAGRLAKYTFTYTGGEPLVVRFELTDDGYDTKWASLGFVGARILQPSDEPAAPGIVLKSADSFAKGSATTMTADFSAADVVDWVHLDSVPRYNSKARMGGARLRFEGAAGTGANSGASAITDWSNVKLSYTNGAVTAAASGSSKLTAYTGLGSTGTFTAPSKAGVQRTLTIFAGSYAGANIDVTAAMGDAAVEVAPLRNGQKTTQLYRYIFQYTGTEAEEPLVVRFTLSDNSTDPSWANLGFYGASITSEEPVVSEPYIAFTTVSLTGQEAVTAPASGKTRRNVTAALFNEQGEKQEGGVLYSLKAPAAGVSVDGEGVLYVTSELAASGTVTVVATSAANPDTFAETQVEVVKNNALRDTPASPLEKDGWVLFYNEEFEGEGPDPRKWSGYYLRSWTTDELAQGHYFVDEGNLVLTAPPDLAQWCSQDANQRVSGIQTFERQHLHRFGTVTGSRELPTFDGFATKYGYFEVRMRLPDTKDGSHFAWWMIGTQDDQHPTAALSGGGQYPEGKYSNETAEFDIIEQTTDAYHPYGGYKTNLWRPVIHPNGSQDLAYLWVPGTNIQNNAINEFHTYGFEWDENGTKFYLDGRLVQSTNRSPNYRMMTIFSLYPGKLDGSAGMGVDRGIYPKDAVIDYFRVYKKDEAPRATSVVLNGYDSPSYLRVPESGAASYPMTAQVLDQFDQPFEAGVTWRFSKDVQGYNPTTAAAVRPSGVSIDPATGVITVQAGAAVNQDLFVTAYVNDKVREVKHIKLSTAAPAAERVLFNSRPDTVQRGAQLDLSAQVYDQYHMPMQAAVSYQLSADHTGREAVNVEGAALSADGVLTVSEAVPAGTYITVTARAAGDANADRMNSLVLKVV